MTFSRICGQCGVTLNAENTGDLQWLQPNCNRCTHTNPTCQHRLKCPKTGTCVHCGFNENLKSEWFEGVTGSGGAGQHRK